MELVYKNEKPLARIALFTGTAIWIAVITGTMGVALIYGLVFALFILFAQSAFISHLKGNAIELDEQQCPDLYAQYVDACKTLDVTPQPTAYLTMSDGILNALATKFLRRKYLVLYSGVVEALRARPEALRFYFGHELGHIKRGHLDWHWLRVPAMVLPLLGAAYRRAQEYSCDLHGLAASRSRDDALAALTVLGSGAEQLPHVRIDRLIAQSSATSGFWMSYHELTGDYPWLCKRLHQVATASVGADGPRQVSAPPKRSFWAGLLALVTPRIGAGGGGTSLILTVAMIGILAAIAIPAYQDYTLRSKVALVLPVARKIEAAAQEFVQTNKSYPESLADIGLQEEMPTGPVSQIEITEYGFELTLRDSSPVLDGTTILVSAHLDADENIEWRCSSGTLADKYLPTACRATAPE